MTSIIPVAYPEQSRERYETEAACQVRCDELTAEGEALDRAEIAEKGMVDGAGARWVPEPSVNGNYWRPRLVRPTPPLSRPH